MIQRNVLHNSVKNKLGTKIPEDKTICYNIKYIILIYIYIKAIGLRAQVQGR